MSLGLYPAAMNRTEETVMHAYLHCAVHEQRLQGLDQAPSPSGSRRRSPGILWSQRGVTQSIPIDGLVATPWSAVDRGTARETPRQKSLRLPSWLQPPFFILRILEV
jgi:hypothetical protein